MSSEIEVHRVFTHLNPFVNVFDPELHTVDYIRSRSRFLFTVLMCAGCKWFKPELFVPLRRMTAVFCLRWATSPSKLGGP